jgi:hypothetical protein
LEEIYVYHDIKVRIPSRLSSSIVIVEPEASTKCSVTSGVEELGMEAEKGLLTGYLHCQWTNDQSHDLRAERKAKLLSWLVLI